VGFTLVEVMIALVIVGIIASMVTLTLGGDRRGEFTAQEAKRLHLLLELAIEEAVYEAKHLGLAIGREGYGFRRYEGDRWIPLEDDQIFHTRPWRRPEIGVRLELADEEVVLPREPPERPQVFVLASGEMTAFRLIVDFGRFPDTEAVVNGSIMGRVWTDLPGEEAEESPETDEELPMPVLGLENGDS
jgi:general secretion pathway protein H